MHRAERMALRAVWRGAGLPFGGAVLAHYRAVNDELWAAYRRGETTTAALAVERFRRTLRAHGGAERLAPRLSRRYLLELAGRGDLLPGTRRLLRALRGRKLAVVTNGIDRVQRSRLRASGLAGHFHAVVTSERAGYAKPDPRLVEDALRALRLRPEDALMIGDDPRSDGAAAHGAGVRFAWVDGDAPVKRANGFPVHWRVRTLDELHARLRPARG
jgi:HAD superfamily hydrolase (TIGR01509 family)